MRVTVEAKYRERGFWIHTVFSFTFTESMGEDPNVFIVMSHDLDSIPSFLSLSLIIHFAHRFITRQFFVSFQQGIPHLLRSVT